MSDALTISYVPGKIFTDGEQITYDKLNQLATPTISLLGTVGTALVTDNSITTVKLVDGVLSADATGRAKMADGYFDASSVSRAKFSPNFFAAGDAQSLALFQDGFWTDTPAARAKFAPGFFASVSPAIGSSRNFKAVNNSGTPNSQVDVSADEIVLKDSDGDPFAAEAVSVTVDITVSGTNGLDTGSEAGNVWYYLYLIYNGSSVAGLLSTSATAPTLPSGYTYSALVGTVRNDASSNFSNYIQLDREIFINDTVIFTAKTGVTSWTAVTSTDLTTLQGIVPPIAKLAWGTAGNTNNNGGIAIGADANALGATANAQQSTPNPVLGYQAAANWRTPLKTPQTIYYIMTATTNGWRVSVSGYKI